MTIYLVRHAKAGSRSAWERPDEERPLSKNGRRQAEELREALAASGATRILSSPYVRCIETVQPLADQLGLPVEASAALAEGARRDDAIELFDKYSSEPTVLCSHGDVIGDLLDECERRGVDLGEARLEKGSTWEFAFVDGRITSARYLAPPA